MHYQKFCNNGKLPLKTLICSIDDESLPKETHLYSIISSFTRCIDPGQFDRIIYIHAVGIYPFEIDQNGNHFVQYDNDMDGIDDRCDFLTRQLFMEFFRTRKLQGMYSFLFGSLADEHKPAAHASWWKTLETLKGQVGEQFESFEYLNHYRVSLINISSVLCPNELISRPFVFSATDADPRFWLQPTEIPPFIENIAKSGQAEHFKEYALFKKADYFTSDYYLDENFTPRKVLELHGN